MNKDQLIVTTIFLLVYGFIISDKVHRLKISMIGVGLILIFSNVKPQKLFEFVDFGVIGLLISMMLIVAIIKETGLIQYIAIHSIKLSAGNPLALMVTFSTLIAVTSAFLDNVTTILLIGPVILVICETLNLKPYPFIFSSIFASNIGGTATLIGDPPNILIGSAAKLSFSDFILNLGPPSLLSFIAMLVVISIVYWNDLKTTEEIKSKLKFFETSKVKVEWKIAKKAIAVLSITFLGFLIHHLIEVDPVVVAVLGASTLLMLVDLPLDKLVAEVDWITILFFSFLFMLVGSLEYFKVIQKLTLQITMLFNNKPTLLKGFLLWGSGVISAIVDNVPYTAAMIPLVKGIITALPLNFNHRSLWWALSLGACLGGNATLVGASANLVMTGLAERSGIYISFKKFLKIGLIITIFSLGVSFVYIIAMY